MKTILPITITLAATSGAFATSIILDDFDDETVTGWVSLGNSLGATSNITETGSNLTSEVIATQSNFNTHRGVVSTTSFDPAGTGAFSLEIAVTSQGSLAPGANGLFLGLTNSNSTFFRTAGVASFGVTLFGFEARTQSQGGVSLVTNDIGATGSATEGVILGPNPNSIQLSSMQEGFVTLIEADLTGWSYTINGVNNPSGTPVTISESGTWAAAGTDFSSVFTGTNWHVLASNQGDPASNTHTLVLDRVELTTIPEPSTGLLGFAALAMLARRRR